MSVMPHECKLSWGLGSSTKQGKTTYEIKRGDILLADRTDILFAFWDPTTVNLFLYSLPPSQNKFNLCLILDYFTDNMHYSTMTNAPLQPAFTNGTFYWADTHYIEAISGPKIGNKYDFDSEIIISNLISRSNMIYFLLNNPKQEKIYFISLNTDYDPNDKRATKRVYIHKSFDEYLYYDEAYGPQILISENGNWLAYHYQTSLFLYNIKQNGPVMHKQFTITPFIINIDNQGCVYYHSFPFENPDDLLLPSWDNELVFQCYTGDDIQKVTSKEFVRYE